MVAPGAQRARRTAASAARDAISTAARMHSAALLDHDADDDVTPARRRALSKRVSYAEIPIDADDLGGPDEEPRSGGRHASSGAEDDEGDGEGDEDVMMDDAEGQGEEAGDAVETGS